MLFKQSNSNKILAQDIISANTILDIYRTIGYSAMAVGPHDLSGGLDLLKRSVIDGSPWVSANILNPVGNPIFPPWVIQQTEAGKLGIIGLTASKVEPTEEYEIADWKMILPQHIDKLFAACDFIILLSNLEDEENIAIAKKFPQIHLIISANQKKGNQPPKITNNTLITQTHTRGKYLGILKVNWSQVKIWQSSVQKTTVIQELIQFIDDQINKISTSTAPYFVERLVKMKEDKMYLEIFKQNNNEIHDGTYNFRFRSLTKHLPESAEIVAKVTMAKKEISRANKRPRNGKNSEKSHAKANVFTINNFAGTNSCLPCHSDQVSRWLETSHARSLASLEREQQQYNLRCLSCHVTRDMTTLDIQDDTQYLLSLPNELRVVGCESCHGPALRHVNSGGDTTTLLEANEASCRKCHTAEMDHEFDYKEKLKGIQCQTTS